ncbi:MAG: MogA/MoaB family molybdenum cofactor biosynthesis protein [Synergistaceae bacterium]|jgi:molybdenum cofactor synthesis domain-containing protein|nr:MogA/MoaB family molybdenum cofactor biosynthesis protein [Synergistaceae bacterium]
MGRISLTAKMIRVLGLYDAARGEWDKLAYIHGGSAGETCVNGQTTRVVFHQAGSRFPADAGYFVVIPGDVVPENAEFAAVNSGELLMKLDRGRVLKVVNSGFAQVSAKVEFWRNIVAGVLTISDRASRGERADTSGPALSNLIEALGAEIRYRAVVSDDRDRIAAQLMEWTDRDASPDLIMTTGGTGFSKRDVTPEALIDVGEKIVPGFGELMRARSMLRTARGCLSRSIAVIRGGTLIIAFPGSETAVRQCFAAVTPSLRHGIAVLNGWDFECGNGQDR